MKRPTSGRVQPDECLVCLHPWHGNDGCEVNSCWCKGPTSSGRVLTPLDRFIAAKTDNERLALGLDALMAAWEEAAEGGNLGWAEEVHEYVHALRVGVGLNRPLGGGS